VRAYPNLFWGKQGQAKLYTPKPINDLTCLIFHPKVSLFLRTNYNHKRHKKQPRTQNSARYDIDKITNICYFVLMKRTKMYICAFSRISLRELDYEFTIVAKNYKRFSNPFITHLNKA
jgi:hypothetical protein